jgi:hypothetical protein
MAVDSQVRADHQIDSSASAAATPFSYSICGLPVRSAVRLPIPEQVSAADEDPAWVIRLGEVDRRAPAEPAVATTRASIGEPGVSAGIAFKTYLDESGSWWWWDGIVTVHISRDARLVDVYPKSGGDERSIGLIMTGPLAAFVMFRLGHPTLHGSAVATPHGAAIFLGSAGYGKSTMAAAFLSRGLPLLADDLVPLAIERDGIYVKPSIPVMKLWSISAEQALGLTAGNLPDVSVHRTKKFLALDGHPSLAHEPVRLRAIYVLDRYEPAGGVEDEITILPLSGREAFATILAQMPCGSNLQPLEAIAFMPLFTQMARQAALRVLRYPGDYASLESVCARILSDLEAR